mmetsp:Transcript_51192/g.163872  ORF Transcript_51192/g.163872 Transcript_51192/m.163872 type:complete len:217 (+) Transcript_51192:1102-1752(+)
MAGLRVTVRDQSLHHAPNGDARRHDASCAHLPPLLPSAMHVLQEAIRTYEAAKGVGTVCLHPAVMAVALQLPPESIGLANADASFAYGAKQDFIHSIVHVIHNSHNTLHLPRIRRLLDALQEDGASDVVRLQSTGLHLFDEHPCTLAAGPDRCIDELVEGHAVRSQAPAGCPHALNSRARSAEVPAEEVLLDHCIVRDDVGHASLQSVRHDPLSGL